MAISKEFLSGSTDGKPVNITGTASGSENTIHTASSLDQDEVWLWASNTDTTNDVTVTLAIGSTANNGEVILQNVTIPVGTTPTPIMAGWIVTNNVTITAFTDTTTKVNVYGYVNRIS